jgi:ADP-heptose:LPS heptosyltransferase
MTRVLAARLDNAGDVLLTGPAIRAIADRGDPVDLLCGPDGEDAAGLLPGITDAIVWPAPWVGFDPPPLSPPDVLSLVGLLATRGYTEAVIFTSFHQSPLPLALLLRMAGVARISAISEDYPGSLLDVRHRVDGDPHEVTRALSLAAAAGFPPPPGDDGRLALRGPLPDATGLTGEEPYVVVHPGASVPARAPSPDRMAAYAGAMVDAGLRVLVTGGPGEEALTARVAGDDAVDLGGRTDLATLAAVLAGADAVVVGNTGPAHLAAAVGTPVVSLFAPVVPAERWHPYGVPCVLLGDQGAPCAGTRARECPVYGHPCLDGIPTADVLGAVLALLPGLEVPAP